VLNGRNREVLRLFKKNGVLPMALKITKEGHPQHPLYQAYALQPKPFWIGFHNMTTSGW
jgi:hypothetical protein